MDRSDFLPPLLLRRFHFLRFAVPSAPRASLPQTQAAKSAGQGLFAGFAETGFIDGGDWTSQVPGGPTMNVPCSPTPAGPALDH